MAVYRYGKKTSDINVQPDFNVKDTKSDAFIKNRPDSTLSISLNGVEQTKQYNPNTGSQTIDIDLTDVLANQDSILQETIESLTVNSVGSNGGYIKTIKEDNGKITATRQAFDTSISNNSTDNNSPTSKAVYTAVETVQDNLETHISDDSKHVPANGTTNSGKFLKSTETAGSYEWSELENIVVLSATSSQTPTRDTRYYIGTANLTTTINKSNRVGLMITVIANVATTIKYPNNSGTVQTKSMEAGTVLPLFSCGSGYTPNLYGLVLDINPSSTSVGQIYIKTE